ncbi:VOC family protein [Comamonadaceae bacterium M7527]|nr:VOC family protein [Comamonadaceae bacterium M7527]
MTAENQSIALFHLAFNVRDLDIARQFYGTTLGCTEGRSSETWVDFSLFNHQLSLHIGEPFATANTGRVGEHLVPMPHFGLVLPLPQWQAMRQRLEAAHIGFVLKPHCRFAGLPGEQWTMFFKDPFGNPIEIKGFADMAQVFAG